MKTQILAVILFSGTIFSISCGNTKQEPLPSPTPTKEEPVVNISTESDFPTFWTNFRKAVLDNNYVELKKRVSFPLATRGVMDGDPIVNFSENEFEKMFSAFLESPTGLNPNNFNETQKQYFQANANIKFNAYKVPMMPDSSTASITSMEFKKGAEGWKLSMLYLDEETYNKSGKNTTASK